MAWFWMSFADDDGHRGCIVIDGEDIGDALSRAHAMGINPGGQVASWELDEAEMRQRVPPEYLRRLLSREEVENMPQRARLN